MTDKLPMRPTGNRIIIEKEEPSLNKGKLILTVAVDSPCLGRVLAVGPGNYGPTGVRMPLEVKSGDRVLYNKHGGQRTVYKEKEYWIFYGDTDIFAIIED